MMGDNRDNSSDSRFDVGYVPLENFVGRANIIFFSIAGKASPLGTLALAFGSSLRPPVAQRQRRSKLRPEQLMSR